MNRTFDFYRSTNSRLYVALDQEDNYYRYVNRVNTIVDRKPLLDKSVFKSMNTLKKIKHISTNYRLTQNENNILAYNQKILTKIHEVQARKNQTIIDKFYKVAFHERRIKEQQKINQENKKFADRVINQQPVVAGSRQSSCHKTPSKEMQASFYESRIKQRRLPKIVSLRS